MEKHITNNSRETKKLAAKIAGQLKGGEVIGLVGELGSGKTVFVQGLAKALGVKEIVNSPTFVLMKIYQLPTPNSQLSNNLQPSTLKQLVHVDCYRLSNSQELIDIGVEEYLGKESTVVVIEWAEKVKDLLPKDSMMVEFKEGENENQRLIRIID